MPEVSPLKLPNERRWALACYVPILNVAICVLAAVRLYGSNVVMLHARQGFILFVMWFLTILIALIAPFVSLVLWVIVLALHGAGFFLAFTSLTVPMPFVGQIAMKLPQYFLYELLTGKTVEKL